MRCVPVDDYSKHMGRQRCKSIFTASRTIHLVISSKKNLTNLFTTGFRCIPHSLHLDKRLPRHIGNRLLLHRRSIPVSDPPHRPPRHTRHQSFWNQASSPHRCHHGSRCSDWSKLRYAVMAPLSISGIAVWLGLLILVYRYHWHYPPVVFPEKGHCKRNCGCGKRYWRSHLQLVHGSHDFQH